MHDIVNNLTYISSQDLHLMKGSTSFFFQFYKRTLGFTLTDRGHKTLLYFIIFSFPRDLSYHCNLETVVCPVL